MADELWDVLMRFHRGVFLPDLDRILLQALHTSVSLSKLENEMRGGFEKMHEKFDRLERAQGELKAGMIKAAR